LDAVDFTSLDYFDRHNLYTAVYDAVLEAADDPICETENQSGVDVDEAADAENESICETENQSGVDVDEAADAESESICETESQSGVDVDVEVERGFRIYFIPVASNTITYWVLALNPKQGSIVGFMVYTKPDVLGR
jgi:hypothetical protein